MIPRTLAGRIFLAFLAVSVLFIVPAGWYAYRSFTEAEMARFRSDLEDRAHLVEQRVTGPEGFVQTESLDIVCGDLGKSSRTNIRLILPDGTVIGNSESGSQGMANQSKFGEIQTAAGGQVGHSVRYSPAFGGSMMFVAVPVFRQGRLVGIIQTSRPVAEATQNIFRVFGGLLLVAALLGLVLSPLFFFWVKRLFRPLEALRKGLSDYAGGNLSRALHLRGTREVEEMTESANRMANQLAVTYQKITSRRNSLDAVLAAMEEGVVFVDSSERINTMNRAAANMLGVESVESIGRLLQEVVRNADLQEFLVRALQSRVPLDGEIVEGKKTWMVHSTHLLDPELEELGTLVVISDITRLLQLESIRKDFVANVSHELRTPITSIKGFLETLQDGAVDRPDEARRFLEILMRHASRLEAIIEDLLTLSFLDQDRSQRTGQRTVTDIAGILRSVVRDYEPSARARNIHIALSLEEGISLPLDPALLSHAVRNLLDNAIKYSEPDGEIQVSTRNLDDEVRVEVADSGCGIEGVHLDRIFERFYRVDPARSRKLGGTGLGLSIVKNIMQIHNGKVTVKSVPAEGSTFTLHFPKN